MRTYIVALAVCCELSTLVLVKLWVHRSSIWGNRVHIYY